jgi:acyl-coenzyme A synthetase/AMP-(fatty) acid ligase
MYRDSRGDYVYVDRADRVIKRSGVRISLVEIGHALSSVPCVSAAAGVLYDNDGQLGIAGFVVTDGTMSALEIRQALGKVLPANMLPDRIELVKDMPLTASSKLDERRLLADAGLGPHEQSTT